MPDHFDVIVVGGGTAGCVLAARLSEAPERTVCLVEAGPDYGRYADRRWPADMLDARTLPMTHLWETEPDDRSASRARIIGGCSAHNACLVVWGSRADYDEWGDGWSFAELEPYLRRAETMLETRTDRAGDLSPFHRALLEAGPRIGLPVLEHPNDLDATVGVAPAAVNARGAVRWNTSFAYLDEARPRPNLTIAAETLVDRVEIDGGRAVGILTDRGRFEADTVIVAAGAYGSPAVLLRSGIGPAPRPLPSRHRSRFEPARRSWPGGSPWCRSRMGRRPPRTCPNVDRCSRPPCSFGPAAARARRTRGTCTSSRGSSRKRTAGGRARSSTS